jgi:hypothetical protein
MVGESLIDVLSLEDMLKLGVKYNVSNMNLGSDGTVSICFRDPLPPSFVQPRPDDSLNVTDEEILMNPYAGMFSNVLPKKG